jgi:type II secretory pathway component PulM
MSRVADTSRQASEELTRIWRSRTPRDRWVLLAALDADVEAVARAGIVAAHPNFTEAQVDRELFRRRYGDQLTRDVFGASRSN